MAAAITGVCAADASPLLIFAAAIMTPLCAISPAPARAFAATPPTLIFRLFIFQAFDAIRATLLQTPFLQPCAAMPSLLPTRHYAISMRPRRRRDERAALFPPISPCRFDALLTPFPPLPRRAAAFIAASSSTRYAPFHFFAFARIHAYAPVFARAIAAYAAAIFAYRHGFADAYVFHIAISLLPHDFHFHAVQARVYFFISRAWVSGAKIAFFAAAIRRHYFFLRRCRRAIRAARQIGACCRGSRALRHVDFADARFFAMPDAAFCADLPPRHAATDFAAPPTCHRHFLSSAFADTRFRALLFS